MSSPYVDMLRRLAGQAVQSQYTRGANVFGARPAAASPDLFVRRSADEVYMPNSYEEAVDQGMRQLGLPGRSEVTNRPINTSRSLPDDMTVDEAAQLMDAIQRGAMLRATPVLGDRNLAASLMEYTLPETGGVPAMTPTQYARDFAVDADVAPIVAARVQSLVDNDIARLGDEAFVTGRPLADEDVIRSTTPTQYELDFAIDADVAPTVAARVQRLVDNYMARLGDEALVTRRPLADGDISESVFLPSHGRVPQTDAVEPLPEAGRVTPVNDLADNSLREVDVRMLDMFRAERAARADARMFDKLRAEEAARRLSRAQAAAGGGLLAGAIGATSLWETEPKPTAGTVVEPDPLAGVVIPDVPVDVPFEMPGITDTSTNDTADYMEQFAPIQGIDIVDPNELSLEGPFSEQPEELTLAQYIDAMAAADNRISPQALSYLRSRVPMMASNANPRLRAMDSGEGDFIFSPDSIEGRAERKVGKGLSRAVRLGQGGR